MKKIAEGEQVCADGHLSGVDAGHIQHIVDQAQKVSACSLDLVQGIDDTAFLIDMPLCEGCHAHDGIHRGPYVMGHIAEEGFLGHIGRVGFVELCLQGTDLIIS